MENLSLQIHKIQITASNVRKGKTETTPCIILKGTIVPMNNTFPSAFCTHCIAGRNIQDSQNLLETSLPVNRNKIKDQWYGLMGLTGTAEGLKLPESVPIRPRISVKLTWKYLSLYKELQGLCQIPVRGKKKH